MRKIHLIALFTTLSLLVTGQNAEQADALFQAQQYAQARTAYESLLSRNKSALYLYRYARCAQEMGDWTAAITYFERAGDKYPLKYFYLGEIYMHLHHPQQAIQSYQTYLNKVPDLSNPSREEYIQNRIRQAEKWERYLKRVERLQVVDSVAIPWDKVTPYCQLSNEAGEIWRDSIGMHYTNQRRDRCVLTIPHQTDTILATSQRLLDAWSTPLPLPSTINMAHLQGYPYMLNDGLTLYFASNDSNGLGGYDLYVSKLNTGTGQYTQPENMGFPYNSEANDYMLIMDEARHLGYLISDRNAAPGYVHIYSFIPSDTRTYWHDISPDSLVAFATLSALYRPDDTPMPPKPQVVAPSDNDDAGHSPVLFILNDTIQYTDSSQFRSLEALALFRDWQALQQQLQLSEQRMQTLRQSYMEGDETKKQELAPAIMHLEETMVPLAEQYNALEKMIRRLELDAATAPSK